jgi:hypothetical protein
MEEKSLKADITRSTFRKNKKYVKVNAQQGRVQVDADYNEQIDIQENLDKTFLQDIIGKTGTPIEDPGFEIVAKNGGYTIGRGRYYVDGILCENGEKTGKDDAINAEEQEDLPDYSNLAESPFNANSATPNQGNGLYVVYLDVWQRHITFLEDPDIREVALGGADTTTRTKTVWQSKILPLKTKDETKALEAFEKWKTDVLSSGKLQVQVTPKQNIDRCLPSPEAGYSGDENRLYRVEIHSNTIKKGKSVPQFKWSRENASVAAKIVQVNAGSNEGEKLIVVLNSWKDERSRLGEGQWIEVTDDYHELWNINGRIVQVTSVEENTLENLSTLKVNDVALGSNESLLHFNPAAPSLPASAYASKNPKVRRWNTPDDKWSALGYSVDNSNVSKNSNEKPVNTASTVDFLDLEDGIQVKFNSGNYVPGDYWLIPARTVTRSLDWPVDVAADGKSSPKWLPSSMEHHYCPLALVDFENGKLQVVYDYRSFFSSLTGHLNLYYVSGDGQEVKKDADKNLLPFDLVAGVAVGGVALKKAKAPFWKPQVQFKVVLGKGTLNNGTKSYIADVDEEGLVRCSWILDSENILQQVKATLIDHTGEAFGLPLIFNGHLPISFFYMSGDGQEITPQNVFIFSEAEKGTATKEIASSEKETSTEAAFLDSKSSIESAKEVAPNRLSPTERKTRRVKPILLKVGAKMGDAALESLPEGNFVVRFEIVDEDKTSMGSLCKVGDFFEEQTKRITIVEVPLNAGMAECNWAFTPPPEAGSAEVTPGKQQVKATLRLKSISLKADGKSLPTLLQPVFFNATFAKPSLQYTCGDGQEVKQEIDDSKVPSQLMVLALAGNVPLPASMTTLWNVKVQFVAKQGTLDPSAKDTISEIILEITDESGIVACSWQLAADPIHQLARAELVDSLGNLIGGPVFFNATFVPELKQAVSSMSGIVKLEFQDRTDKVGPLISNPILHSLENQEIPPAIVLALLPPINVDFAEKPIKEDAVEHFEDFCLYDWAVSAPRAESKYGAYPPFPRFKAVDVNTKSFRILMEPPCPQLNWMWYIRWWAIPAQRKDLQKASFEPAVLEPKINILDKAMAETAAIAIAVPFIVTVEDHNVQTETLSVNLKIPAIDYSKSIVLFERNAKDKLFFTAITLNTNFFEILKADGKVDKFELPTTIKAGEIRVDYQYKLRQGFAPGTVTASATLGAVPTSGAMASTYTMKTEVASIVDKLTTYKSNANFIYYQPVNKENPT